MNLKQVIYKKVALLLAILVFYASVGLAIDMHYCQGNMKSFAFFGKAKNCYELATGKKACPKHDAVKPDAKENDSIRSQKCCSSKSVLMQSDSDQLIPATGLSLNPPSKVFLLAYTAVFLLMQEEISIDYSPYARYKPPLVQRDLPVLFASFLL